MRRETYKKVDTRVVCSREGNCVECHTTYSLQPITGLVCTCNISKYHFNYKKPLWEFLDAAPTYWRYLETLCIRVMKKLTKRCFELMLAHFERQPELNIMQYAAAESHLH